MKALQDPKYDFQPDLEGVNVMNGNVVIRWLNKRVTPPNQVVLASGHR